jgi:hypothetical protein
MTMARYLALRRYWARHPPVHLMVAAYLGIGKSAREPECGDLGELVAAFDSGVIR